MTFIEIAPVDFNSVFAAYMQKRAQEAEASASEQAPQKLDA